MEAEDLIKFGLTEGESKVYLALLNIGKSTIGDIIKEANVSNSKVYDILDRLNKKGLIGIANENNRKSFEAKSPKILKEIIREQEKEIIDKKNEFNKIIPKLEDIYKSHEVRQEAEILQGIKGIISFHRKILDISRKGDTILILGAPKEANEKLNAHLLEWHEDRIKKGIKCKILYNADAMIWATQRKKLNLTEIRFLPENFNSPVAINISDIYVGNLVFSRNPFCFSIKNQEISKNYKEYFNYLWNISKK